MEHDFLFESYILKSCFLELPLLILSAVVSHWKSPLWLFLQWFLLTEKLVFLTHPSHALNNSIPQPNSHSNLLWFTFMAINEPNWACFLTPQPCPDSPFVWSFSLDLSQSHPHIHYSEPPIFQRVGSSGPGPQGRPTVHRGPCLLWSPVALWGSGHGGGTPGWLSTHWLGFQPCSPCKSGITHLRSQSWLISFISSFCGFVPS